MTMTITLHGDALVPLRSALYWRLDQNAAALSDALAVPAQESKLEVRNAYRELHKTGALLERLGWREQETQHTIELDAIIEARLVIDALTTELTTQTESVGTARGFGEDHKALVAERRWQAVHAALWQIEAATASATTDETDNGGDAKA